MAKQKSKETIPRTPNLIAESGYGFNFEHSVQTFLLVQMFTGGFVPKMGPSKITRMVLQSGRFGRKTDDCELTLENSDIPGDISLLIQIKRSFNVTKTNSDFTKVIAYAWEDFMSDDFDRTRDHIMVITGMLNDVGRGLKRRLIRMQSVYASSSRFWDEYHGGHLKDSSNQVDGFALLLEKLEEANGGALPDEGTIFNFCRVFHIVTSDMHDANFENGDVNIALVHSALSGYRWKYGRTPADIWKEVHAYVSENSQHGAAIHRDELPEQLLKIFATDRIISRETSGVKEGAEEVGRSTTGDVLHVNTELKRELALLCAIGGIDFSNENDRLVIESIFGESHLNILKKIQDISSTDSALVKLEDTVWRAVNPTKTLAMLSSYIFDNHIDAIGEAYLKVLGESDPALSLPVEERHMAALHSRSRLYSNALRDGLAEGLAVLSINRLIFKNCSPGKINSAAKSLVDSLLVRYEKSETWASVLDNLEAVAWTSPKGFLVVVEKTLSISFADSPFVVLAKDSDAGLFFGRDYLSGIRRALASLARDAELFTRSVAALTLLASYEKEQSHERNSTLSSIVELVLPWHPGTQATPKTRYAAVGKILDHNRDYGRYILRQLLPGVTQTTAERGPLLWNASVSRGAENTPVTMQEVYEQSSYYSQRYVNSSNSSSELVEVIEDANHLTDDSMDKFVEDFTAKIDKLTDEGRLEVWSALVKVSNRLGRRAAASSRSSALDLLMSKVEPVGDIEKSIHLFSNYDHDLINTEDWVSGEKRVRKEREKALSRIIEARGLDGLRRLIEAAKLPHLIGSTLGAIENTSIHGGILPEFIKSESAYEAFYGSYIYALGLAKRSELASWASAIGFSGWTNEEKVRFTLSLPMNQNTWSLFKGEDYLVEEEYWGRIKNFVSINQVGYSTYAVASLLKAKRPLAALECVYWSSLAGGIKESKGESIDIDQVLDALLQSISTQEDVTEYSRLNHEVGEIFNYLYDNSNFSNTDLWKAEWAYLAIFRSNSTAKPRALIQRIVDDAGFFCELVRMGYKSTNKSKDEALEEVPDGVRSNLFRLLTFNDFSITLGIDQGGVFHKTKLVKWIDEVERICRESGHLEVARSIMGEYLVSSPEDPSGLWIDESVIKVMDRNEAAEMRQGYNTGVYNSRGIHTVDPSGSDEEVLRDLWRSRANQVDEKGYTNVATSLRNLADGYEEHREHVVRRGSYRGY